MTDGNTGTSTSSSIARVARTSRSVDLISGAYADGSHGPAVLLRPRADAATASCSSTTGFMQRGQRRGDSRASSTCPDWISPLRMLEELGVAADDVTDIVLSHAHFDHMGSIAEFPKARLYIQKRELLSWIRGDGAAARSSATSPRSSTPTTSARAFDASIEHRLTLIDGDKDNVLPGIHVRLGERPHDRPAVRHRSRPARGRIVVSGDCVYSRTQHHRPQPRRRLRAAQQRRRQRLGAAQDHRPHQRRDRRRPLASSSSCTTSSAGRASPSSRRSRASGSSRCREPD